MRYLKQLFIIILFSFFGELLHYVLPVHIPASIYGLVALFVALETGIVKLSYVKETAGFLIAVMPLMFIPAGVGLMNSWGELLPILLPVVVIMLVSTVLVMGVAGRVTQAVIRRREPKENGGKDGKGDKT